MEYAVATLKKGEGRALKAGGAWILRMGIWFSSGISTATGWERALLTVIPRFGSV